MQSFSIQYNTIQYNALQCNYAKLYNTMQCFTMQLCKALWYNTLLYNTIQCFTLQCNAREENMKPQISGFKLATSTFLLSILELHFIATSHKHCAFTINYKRKYGLAYCLGWKNIHAIERKLILQVFRVSNCTLCNWSNRILASAVGFSKVIQLLSKQKKVRCMDS